MNGITITREDFKKKALEAINAEGSFGKRAMDQKDGDGIFRMMIMVMSMGVIQDIAKVLFGDEE